MLSILICRMTASFWRSLLLASAVNLIAVLLLTAMILAGVMDLMPQHSNTLVLSCVFSASAASMAQFAISQLLAVMHYPPQIRVILCGLRAQGLGLRVSRWCA